MQDKSVKVIIKGGFDRVAVGMLLRALEKKMPGHVGLVDRPCPGENIGAEVLVVMGNNWDDIYELRVSEPVNKGLANNYVDHVIGFCFGYIKPELTELANFTVHSGENGVLSLVDDVYENLTEIWTRKRRTWQNQSVMPSRRQ